VSGNLEENPDGSGSGPSVRWVSILYVQGEPVYFAGTSCGLFSTTQLNGMETIWTQEGATTIGNVVIDMIDVRQSDGFVVIGTHGNGVYSTYITELPVHIEATADHNAQYKLFQAYPNPFNSTTKIAFTLPRANYTTLKIFDTLGREVSTLVSRELNQGNHTYTLEGINLASGIYYYQLAAGDFRAVKKIILLR
jgi:hypothetical protein